MVSLLDMPDVPMNLILGHVGPSVIFSLRKVCRSLRYYIDETKPELYFDEILIRLEYKQITIYLYHHLEILHISYMIQENGFKTSVFDGNNRKEKFIENVDYMEGFWNDYNIIKMFQNQCLQRFKLSWSLIASPDVADISKFLEQYKSSRSFRAIQLYLGIYHGDEVPIILQRLDPDFLQDIRFFDYGSNKDKNFDFAEIVKLDQWKNAQSFTTRSLPIPVPMKHFTHFSYIDAEFRNSDAEDLKLLAVV